MRISERRWVILQRVHTLSGWFPIGLFLLAHFGINLVAVRGSVAYNRLAGSLDHLPLVRWIEWLGIGLPIAVHVVLGALLGNTDQSLARAPGYPRPWMRTAQRWSGGVLVTYVLFHVWATRLSPEVLKGDTDLFALMSKQLSHPAVIALYALGVLAAATHFGIGMFGVADRWIADHDASAMRARWVVAWTMFALIGIVGLTAMLAFVTPRARWLGRPATESAMRAPAR